ncbi:hypothetical protein Q1695_004456 [Nippostrongylus brasiliensis]|nr:hypothetical protein Q1695_004456 [Nippostrongylus brasiliensis]
MASSVLTLPLLALPVFVICFTNPGGPMIPAITPCSEMNCTGGTHCKLGKVICPRQQPCPDKNCPIASCYARQTKCVKCGKNMHTDTCGSVCPQTCVRNAQQCLAISCTERERCFCNADYVLLNGTNPEQGCVKAKDCPK